MVTEDTSKTIGVVIPSAERSFTSDKIGWLAKWCQTAGFTPVILHTDTNTAAMADRAKMIHISCQIHREGFDVFATAPHFIQALNRPLAVSPNKEIPCPTLGELIGFDDFFGISPSYRLEGGSTLAAAAVVLPIPGSEMPIDNDDVLTLMVWRWCLNHHIPIVGVEVASLRNPLFLRHYPVDVLLTKNDPRPFEKQLHEYGMTGPCVRMALSHRYVCSAGINQEMEMFIAGDEPRLRQSIPVPPGAHLLYLPFHLGYKERCTSLLENMVPFVPTLLEAGFHLMISVDPTNTRRLLTEEAIVRQGFQRWLTDWPPDRVHIVDIHQASMVSFVALSDAVLAPCASPATEWADRWGVTVVLPGEEAKLNHLAVGLTLPETLSWMLQKEEA